MASDPPADEDPVLTHDKHTNTYLNGLLHYCHCYTFWKCEWKVEWKVEWRRKKVNVSSLFLSVPLYLIVNHRRRGFCDVESYGILFIFLGATPTAFRKRP